MSTNTTKPMIAATVPPDTPPEIVPPQELPPENIPPEIDPSIENFPEVDPPIQIPPEIDPPTQPFSQGKYQAQFNLLQSMVHS